METCVVAEVKGLDLVKNDETIQSTHRIQVSNKKKPLFFYVNLAKRHIKQHDNVELSALGMAIPTVVVIAEILKNTGLAIEKKILTSTIDKRDENKGRTIYKPKIEIVLAKNENASNEQAPTSTIIKPKAQKFDAARATQMATETLNNLTITAAKA